MIDEKEVTAYVTMPDCFLQGAAKILLSSVRTETILPTTEYMKECSFSFDWKMFKKGFCYINTAGDDRPKYRWLIGANIDGYKHFED